MTTYRVTVKEVWYQDVIVEAEDENTAVSMVADGMGDIDESDDGFQYSHSQEPDTWDVVEEKVDIAG